MNYIKYFLVLLMTLPHIKGASNHHVSNVEVLLKCLYVLVTKTTLNTPFFLDKLSLVPSIESYHCKI